MPDVKKGGCQQSVERIHRFQCLECHKAWSIENPDRYKRSWYCPWCGISLTANYHRDNSYTPGEDTFLRQKWIDGTITKASKNSDSVRSLARQMERTPQSLLSRAYRLGLKASDRKNKPNGLGTILTEESVAL